MQFQRIVILMVFGHVGAGDQNGCPAHGFQLGQRKRAGAADHQIGGGQQGGHILNILPHFKVLIRLHMLLLHHAGKRCRARLARGVNVANPAAGVFFFPRSQLRHHLVDGARAQAAAKAYNECFIAKAHGGTHRLTVLLKQAGANRIAHHQSFFGCAQFFHRSLHRSKHHRDLFGQQLVGHPRKSILLVNGRGNAHARRTSHHRAAHIAAAADHKIRLYLPDDRLGAGHGERQMIHRLDIAHNVFGR